MNTCSVEDLATELECFDSEKATNTEKLQLAKCALELALDLTLKVAHDTNDDHAKAYFVDHLTILATRDHGFLSRDFNIDQWIDRLDRAEEEGEAEEG